MEGRRVFSWPTWLAGTSTIWKCISYSKLGIFMDFIFHVSELRGALPKLTCPLKGDYFNSKCIWTNFQRSRVFWGEPTLRVGNGWVGSYGPLSMCSWVFFGGKVECVDLFFSGGTVGGFFWGGIWRNRYFFKKFVCLSLFFFCVWCYSEVVFFGMVVCHSNVDFLGSMMLFFT